MSGFTGAAAGIGAAATVGGAISQSSAASDAAATSAGQSTVNAAALRAAGVKGDALLSQSGTRADQLLSGSGKKADQLLQAGYKGAVQDMRPYDRLGMQGSNALARYLGFVTEYQGKKPTKPAKGATAASQKKYKNALAEYNANKANYSERMRNASGLGDYFDPYTQKDLMADPVYQTELDENVRAWDNSAASRGSLMSGNTVAGLRDLTAAGIERGYNRDWNQRERKYNAYAGLNNMGLGVRTNLANARLSTATQRANAGLQVGANRANTGVTVGTNRANTLLAGAGNQANYLQQGADARGSGQLASGNAYGNAFGNIGSLGLLYGAGAFGGGQSQGRTMTNYYKDLGLS